MRFQDGTSGRPAELLLPKPTCGASLYSDDPSTLFINPINGGDAGGPAKTSPTVTEAP